MRIAHNELRRARAEVGNFGRSHLLFNISERLQLDVAVERTTRTLDGYTLSGNIDGGKGGFVTLAVHGQAVAGSLWTWEAKYEIEPVRSGVHVVGQVMDDPVECAGAVQSQSVEPATPAPTTSTSDEAAVVDILVLWTPALEAAMGDESHVKLTIDFAIAYANDALERSGALVSLNLVGSELWDVEEGHLHAQGLLTSDHATERANALGADFVSAFIAGLGGWASLSTSAVGFPHAQTFAHEVGHNLGVDHDRGAEGGKSYNAAYVLVSTGHAATGCYITAVAYPHTCPSFGLIPKNIPYYSTPNRHHPLTGAPLGVSGLSNSRDWNGPADAVLAINRNRHRNSNIRTRPARP